MSDTTEQDLFEEMNEEAPVANHNVDEENRFPTDEMESQVVEALRTVYDPEIPVNIYDLGLIYDLQYKEREVMVQMTLTAPGCPVAEYFPTWVSEAVRTVEGVDDAQVEIVWDPPWSIDRMSEEAKLELGFM